MTFKNKLLAIKKVLAIKFLGKKVPLVVTWPITNRCNFRCQYCERWKRTTRELTTSQVFTIIDQLKTLGTIRISLSGGEPLIRDDIGRIIDYAKKSGISVVLTSNGSLVKQKIKELKNLNLLKLSVEGKEKVHDKIRGKGSFKKVLEAAEVAKKDKIKFVFNSVLTRHNLDQIEFLLNLAKKFKTGVRFTALNTAHAGRKQVEPLYPTPEAYRKAVARLIEAKRKGKPVLNSFAGLDYLKSWPKPQKLECFASRAFTHLGANGNLYPCVILEGKAKPQNVLKSGLTKAFASLNPPRRSRGRCLATVRGVRCPGCWCGGTLELNLLLGLKPSVIVNAKKLL